MTRFEDLAPEEQAVVRRRYRQARKSLLAAYLMWFFLGVLGTHRFYLGKNATGALQLILSIFAAILIWFIGIFFLALVVVWLLIDAVLMPFMVAAHNKGLREGITFSLFDPRGGLAKVRAAQEEMAAREREAAGRA